MERRGDATALSADSTVLALLSAAKVGRPGRDSFRRPPDLKSDLDRIAKAYGYSGIYVLDGDGRVAGSSSEVEAMNPNGRREGIPGPA
jgi:hypothetical protein